MMTDMAAAAWAVRRNARLHGKTAVGAAVLADDGRIYVGCNIEHRFRAHDVHAEVNALTSMVAAGSISAVAVLIVAERDSFTPCGGCLDWIFELGGGHVAVGFQGKIGGEISVYRADELMPHYPR